MLILYNLLEITYLLALTRIYVTQHKYFAPILLNSYFIFTYFVISTINIDTHCPFLLFFFLIINCTNDLFEKQTLSYYLAFNYS